MHELPPELEGAVDEYDRDHHEEVAASYDELFEVLRELHALAPEWRFGQMVCNLASWSGESRPGDVWDVPDGRLLEAARHHLHNRREAANDAGPTSG